MSLVGFLCGTPDQYCVGGKLQTDQHLGHTKFHSSRMEAFKCHKNYLIKILGFKQELPDGRKLGARELWTGDSIRILSKVSKFGGELRRGKSESHKTQRRMPKIHNKDVPELISALQELVKNSELEKEK
jgi:hypothetical protein